MSFRFHYELNPGGYCSLRVLRLLFATGMTLSARPGGKFIEHAYRGDLIRMKKMINSGHDVDTEAEFRNACTQELELTTALCVAARHGVVYSVDFLVENGANVEYRLENGNSPLMEAARRGQLRAVIALLEAGAKTAPKNEQGKTAADLAEEKGYTLISRLLNDPSSVTIEEIRNFTSCQSLRREKIDIKVGGVWGILRKICFN